MARVASARDLEASMPASYREAFDQEARQAHAGIVSRRDTSATRVEIWQELPGRVVAVCIVADDRPGLLSQICSALVALEIDVVAAHAYGHARPDGALEAVDFLWLRRVARMKASGDTAVEPIGAREVAAIGEMVDALVRGNAKFDPAVHFARALRTSRETTRIRFDDSAGDGTMTLTVEATDQPGLLLVVSKAIFRAELQILGLRATSEHGLAVDRFHLAELDGRPLVQARLLSLQVEILAALEDGDGDDAHARAATG